jgi:hypothetical protein
LFKADGKTDEYTEQNTRADLQMVLNGQQAALEDYKNGKPSN